MRRRKDTKKKTSAPKTKELLSMNIHKPGAAGHTAESWKLEEVYFLSKRRVKNLRERQMTWPSGWRCVAV